MRVSYEQKIKLLEFMQAHEDLARGRVTGPDAARRKKQLLEELASALNSMGSGATKTSVKWLKCWQDWKCDVKSKAAKIKKQCGGTGGGPSPAPLSNLEERLMEFFGFEMVQGLEGIPDPLEIAVSQNVMPAQEPAIEMEEVPTVAEQTQPQKRRTNDRLHEVLDRQATAIENIATGMHEVAAALQEIAAAIQAQQRIIFDAGN